MIAAFAIVFCVFAELKSTRKASKPNTVNALGYEMKLAKFILTKNFSASNWPKSRLMRKKRYRGIRIENKRVKRWDETHKRDCKSH